MSEAVDGRLASFLHAANITWQRRYGTHHWSALHEHVAADAAFRDHLLCTLRAALLGRRNRQPRLRLTLVGGSF